MLIPSPQSRPVNAYEETVAYLHAFLSSKLSVQKKILLYTLARKLNENHNRMDPVVYKLSSALTRNQTPNLQPSIP
jgi:hypothetical protein